MVQFSHLQMPLWMSAEFPDLVKSATTLSPTLEKKVKRLPKALLHEATSTVWPFRKARTGPPNLLVLMRATRAAACSGVSYSMMKSLLLAIILPRLVDGYIGTLICYVLMLLMVAQSLEEEKLAT